MPALLLAIILCLSLLPGTAWAADFPSRFYASVTYKYESNTKYQIFGTVTQSGDTLTYSKTGEKMDRVVYGMEYAGGAFFTVEGNKLPRNEDDGLRELRMYNSDLTSYRTIGEVNQEGGGYWIVDTAMDLSGEAPALYGTYNTVIPDVIAMTMICTIDLETAEPGNYLQVTGLPDMHIIYAIAFNKDGTLYAIGADGGADGGPATLYTIDLDNVQTGSYGSQTVAATKVADIKSQTDSDISTNFCQDLAFDHATSTLYWAENDDNVLYTVDTTSAVATSVGSLPTLQSFCIPYDAAFGQADDQHMVSVVCEGAGTVTSNNANSPFYMVDNGDDITLNITPDAGSGLRYVKVDGSSIPTTNLVENGYTFTDVTKNHVIEVGFKLAIPATQKTVTWLHYQGEPASFYTVDNVYKFYDLPDRFEPDFDAPTTGYIQTLLDENEQAIADDTVILPGNYDVHVTHPGNGKYAAMDVIYTDALQLGKCPGTPGRPVVYGKVGCKQGDLSTTSALQDYYGTDGKLIDAAYDEIPVTLVWQNPETTYNEAGNFSASATIHAAKELDQRLKDCYTLDDGSPLTENCLISSRATQVVVLPADEASLIKLLTSDASGGTVSGKGVYKNGDKVTVTATVNGNAGYEFKGWQEGEDIVSTNATYTFDADGDRTLTALFELSKKYTVRLTVDPTGAGTVTGSGSYDTGEHKATVTATANQGYYFIGWYKGDNLESANASYEVTVPEDGITLTAKFGIDYLARAEQAKTNFASAVSTDAFEWQTLVQAVDAYQTAADFVENPPSGIDNASNRYAALTTYYNGIKKLDLSNQGIGSADLAKLALFTGVTELNLSGNKDVTDLTSLKNLTVLETLDISGTGVTTLDSLVPEDSQTFPGAENLTAKNLSLNSISALAELVGADDFDAGTVTQWDFSGSTLTDTEDNHDDVETIKAELGAKFLPPTIPTTPVEPEQPVTPVVPSGSDKDDDDDGYSVSVPASSSIRGGAVSVSPRRADRGDTVTITVKPDSGYELDELTVATRSGSELALTSKGNGRYTFTMPGSSVKIQVSFKEIAEQVTNPFTDVYESDYYYDAVLWAVENGVTSGTSAVTFGPHVTVTRAQAVTFLWRAHGSPKATGSNPFTDVSRSNYYYDAVLWAVEHGVTSGTTATTFGPNAPVTRAQAVTFQWRASGSPAVSGGSFSDVAADAYYSGAVAWAVANGITNGTGGNKFSPEVTVTRAQAVTFLWRELA